MAELTSRMKELVQPYLAGIEPYDPNFTPTRINLSANENTYPVPAGVREAIDAALAATPLNRYPDPMSNDLRDELAAWHGVTRENICVGNGGDELLYNYLLAFGGAGRTLLNCPPCFSEYAFFASLCQTEVRDVWRDPATFELDQAAVLAAAPECNLAIVTSPNNPTGDVAPLDFIAALCDACPGMVMVDEAYVEFADDSFGAATTAQGLIAEHPNLVILHTLSKAFGAAGTRLGYVIAAPEVIDVFAAIRQIYSVNVLSQAAALACVRARDAYTPVVAQVASERERELATIKVLGFRRGEVHHYVNKETLILTAIGAALGVPLGGLLAESFTYILQMPSLYFDVEVEPLSYVLAVVLSFGFTFIVNLATNRTLNKIDMVGALKSAE